MVVKFTRNLRSIVKKGQGKINLALSPNIIGETAPTTEIVVPYCKMLAKIAKCGTIFAQKIAPNATSNNVVG